MTKLGIYPASGDPLQAEQMRKSLNIIGIDYSTVARCYTFEEISSKGVDILFVLGEKANTEIFDLARPGLYSYVGGMETIAGQLFSHPNFPCYIYPNYNPRVISVSEELATAFCRAIDGFKRFATEIKPIEIKFDIDKLPETNYALLAVDTEGSFKKPWCATFYPPFYDVTFSQDAGQIRRITTGPRLLFHSALHDVRVLKTYGADVVAAEDTILQAYHLSEPLGLKELTFRHTGLVLTPYQEVVKEAATTRLEKYICEAMSREWPLPEGRNWPVARRLATILKALAEKGPNAVYAAWRDRNRADLVKLVEEAIGPLPETTLEHVDFEAAKKYAELDPICTMAVHNVLRPKIEDMKLGSVYATDIAIIPMLNRIQVVGLPVDRQRIADLTQLVDDKIRELNAEMVEKFGPKFNPASSDDTAEAIEKEGKVELHKTTKTGKISTEKAVLKSIQSESVVAGLVYKWRELSKLKTTYVPAITKFVDEDNRIRPKLRTTNTDTGRLSCGDPNLLAFPARTEIGTMFRKCFVAPTGWKFVNIDLAQIEMRIMAHESQDSTMIRVINEGLDLHTATAAMMFKVPPEEVTKAQRTPAKSISFLVIYEGGPRKLMGQMAAEGIQEPIEYWKDLIDKWYAIYPRVKEYQEERHREAMQNGYVRNFWGRIRYVSGCRSLDRQIAARCLRQASNDPIQSGAQVLIKRAMARIWQRIHNIKWIGNAEILLQVHDELVGICKEDRVEDFLSILKEEMLRDGNLFDVKLDCSTGIGESWGDLK
jgi:DNA polymerase I-like protein with 3'-5' exonuclease and polymerase domains